MSKDEFIGSLWEWEGHSMILEDLPVFDPLRDTAVIHGRLLDCPEKCGHHKDAVDTVLPYEGSVSRLREGGFALWKLKAKPVSDDEIDEVAASVLNSYQHLKEHS